MRTYISLQTFAKIKIYEIAPLLGDRDFGALNLTFKHCKKTFEVPPGSYLFPQRQYLVA